MRVTRLGLEDLFSYARLFGNPKLGFCDLKQLIPCPFSRKIKSLAQQEQFIQHSGNDKKIVLQSITMNWLMMALWACSMLLTLGAVQLFVIPMIVRSELKCRSNLFGQPLSGRCFRPLQSHGPLQAYVEQQASSLNDSSDSFSGSLQRLLAEDVEIKSFQLFDPIQLFVVPQNSKSKKNTSKYHARA